MKTTYLALSLLPLAACAARHPVTPPAFVEAHVLPRPPPSPPVSPPHTASYLAELPPDIEGALAEYMRNGKAPLITTVKTGDLSSFPMDRANQRCVKPDTIGDIELEQGEEVLDLAAADTVRWQFQPLREGPKDKRTVHVLVKPQDVIPMETDLVIGTDRRTYRIHLKSSPTIHAINVRFYYPDDIINHFNAAQEAEQHDPEPVIAKLPDINLESLSTDYSIQGHAPFAPVFVGGDGSRMYLKFASDIGTTGVPAVFVKDKGNQALVNYSIKGSYLVIQGQPQEVVLRKGVGGSAQQVTITRGQ